jgi:outer membrane lipoprotein-sorting protein
MTSKFFLIISASLIVVFACEVQAQSIAAKEKESGSAVHITADDILRLSDRSRNGWDTYFVRTTIRNFEDNNLKEEGVFDVSMKGMDKTLVKFLNADVKGQYLLMIDDDMWIYMPNTRKPIRITPLQRLMGNASNGDVARTRYAQDYTAAFKREESIDGMQCYVLELSAKREGATYKKIDYWITKNSFRPQKAEMYLISGKHYKTIHFDTYEEIQGRMLVTQVTITDRLREGRMTIMKYAGYAPKEIPEKYFNKDYLEKLR